MFNENILLNRITVDPKIFGAKPIIRGMRISVEMILGQLSQGMTTKDIIKDYPNLEPEDIFACLAYAHTILANESIEEIRVST
ncbi:hypothetical protein A3J90_03790 [candidate division WOR-1 bacterium RIFOXYC2_FULL_37_10]|uniref:Antitoxin n=1 Tax=candidate division WOR-1 bacterium RIFOXYB2_FULL_37_13 TaxID=1802579 RepID=A0A1F4SWL7_UNCSA|nr:MAG: hypothetical protein A2246_06400 [candidate division WOR-1 bacterium RIFOXYA2_FULL_37_7]OGC24831.1 MAG: hypothetical protein A2310_03730 [candidate division WOR-1 bacterium RIFOXYB2_FULL_37_13]OGC33779.1 MAG: hypothetical protein A3J90_03790 [candidate division WOR-1 bacterium RIFOXYC2_FULL_37_10]